MKQLIKIGAVAIALCSLATSVYAGYGGSQVSFNTTNVLTANASISVSGLPTNTVATNGLYAGTGSACAISQFDNLGLGVQGWVVDTNNVATNSITINFVVALANGQPQTILGTNIWAGTNQYGTNYVTFTDWEYGITNFSVTFSAVAGGTNFVNAITNIPSSAIPAGANWIGIQGLQFLAPPTAFITNFGVYLNTKSIPKPIGY
jgi:hypothetical protein